MTDAIPNVASGDANIDALTMKNKWVGPSATYSVPTDEAQYGDYAWGKVIKGVWVPADETEGFVAPTALFTQAVRDAMAQVGSFTALDLVELTGGDQGDADIRAGVTTTPKPWSGAGRAYAAGPKPEDDPVAYLGGDTWFPTGRNEVFGTRDHITVAHELGHTLGLNDIIEGGTEMTADRQSTEFSIMTYSTFIGDNDSTWNHAYGNTPQSYMMYDIAALQFMYGADFTTNGGDTTYAFDAATGEMSINGTGQGVPVKNILFRTVWDGGGIDTYDFGAYGADRDLDVDLSPGGWSDVDRDSTFQAANLKGGPNGGYARGQVFNALLHEGDERSLIENVVGGAGDDSIRGNQAQNHLIGGAGDDTLHGLDGIDTLDQGSGGGALYGGNDQDLLIAGDGAETLDGGADTDRVDYSRSTAGVTVDLALGTGSGGFAQGDTLIGIEQVIGSDHADALFGRDARDVLRGGGGNDLLVGRDGDDHLDGHTGSDTLVGGEGADYLFGGKGVDVVRYDGVSIALNLATGVHTGDAAGDIFTLVERFQGSEFADTMAGDAGANHFSGRGGDDLLQGAGGNDTLIGGAGNDTLEGGAGLDTADFSAAVGEIGVNLALGLAVTFGVETDVVSGIETVIGSAFDDDLRGDAGANLLRGGDGDDRLEGGAGADSLWGWFGDDTIVGDAGDDVDGSAGTDELRFGGAPVVLNLATGVHGGGAAGMTIKAVEVFIGTAGADAMTAGAALRTLDGAGGNDTVTGGKGRDFLRGGEGEDRIVGLGGDDFLRGGAGDDWVEPGAGVDVIQYGLGDGHDSVLGFSAADDTIVLYRATFGAPASADIADWIVFGGAAPDAGHGYLLMDGDTLRWDADGGGPTAGAVDLMTFYRGEAPTSVNDFVWG